MNPSENIIFFLLIATAMINLYLLALEDSNEERDKNLENKNKSSFLKTFKRALTR